MKATFKALMAVAILAAVAMVVQAEDKEAKEVTLKGTLGCGKCVFKLSKDITKGACVNAIRVKDGDKELTYVIDDGGRKAKYHGKICTSKKEGSVTGVVTTKATADKVGKIKPSKDGVKIDD